MTYHRLQTLIASWENGTGWEELCTFLEIKRIPRIPFPHDNPSWNPGSQNKKSAIFTLLNNVKIYLINLVNSGKVMF